MYYYNVKKSINSLQPPSYNSLVNNNFNPSQPKKVGIEYDFFWKQRKLQPRNHQKHGGMFLSHVHSSGNYCIMCMMGKKKDVASKLVTQALTGGAKTKKELKHVVRARDGGIDTKYVRKALKGLIKSGLVKQEGKVYHVVVTETMETEVPIGMRLRGPQEKKVKFVEPSNTAIEDLDDEIARLERELAKDDSDGSSDTDTSDDEDHGVTDDAEETAVLSLSAFAEDRIQQLPKTLLPEPGRYNLDKLQKNELKLTSKKTNKQTDSTRIVESGLQQAVKEVLEGYTARSAEKIPFYCRFCSKQYANEKEFFDHKNTEFHKVAEAMERRATYCKLCRRQLTSPTQMKEHLKSRPHKDKLQEVRSRQVPRSKRQFV